MAQMAPLGLKARCPAGRADCGAAALANAWHLFCMACLRGVQDQVQGAMAVMQAAGCLRLPALSAYSFLR